MKHNSRELVQQGIFVNIIDMLTIKDNRNCTFLSSDLPIKYIDFVFLHNMRQIPRILLAPVRVTEQAC